MSVLESLLVDAFGLSIVFAVLIVLCFVIKLISKIVGGIQQKAGEKSDDSNKGQVVSLPDTQEQQNTELQLINVDEKTAALIMAIVSKNTNIPLSKLNFISIKLVK